MASQYYIVINLDPHIQQFLRSYFKCETEIFKFPPRHYFNFLLEDFVITKPPLQIEQKTDKQLFKIFLPNFKNKNPQYYRYLNKAKETIFRRQIKAFYDRRMIIRIMELLLKPRKLKNGIKFLPNLKQCVLIVIDEYEFDKEEKDPFDRLYKAYSRFEKKEKYRMIDKKNRGE